MIKHTSGTEKTQVISLWCKVYRLARRFAYLWQSFLVLLACEVSSALWIFHREMLKGVGVWQVISHTAGESDNRHCAVDSYTVTVACQLALSLGSSASILGCFRPEKLNVPDLLLSLGCLVPSSKLCFDLGLHFL